MTPEERNLLRAKVMHAVTGVIIEVGPDHQATALEATYEAALTMLINIAPDEIEAIAYRVISKVRESSFSSRAPSPWRPLVKAVAERHGVTVEDLQGHSRQFSAARHEAWYELRQILDEGGKPRWSLPTIGRWFGNRDHTSVLYGVRSHEALIGAAARDMARISV